MTSGITWWAVSGDMKSSDDDNIDSNFAVPNFEKLQTVYSFLQCHYT